VELKRTVGSTWKLAVGACWPSVAVTVYEPAGALGTGNEQENEPFAAVTVVQRSEVEFHATATDASASKPLPVAPITSSKEPWGWLRARLAITVNVAAAELTVSLARAVWLPEVLAGIAKVQEKSPELSVVN
jgi:hypothetical protein